MQDFFHQQKEGLRPTRGHSSQTLKQLVGKTLYFFGYSPGVLRKDGENRCGFLVKNRCPVKCVDFFAIASFRYLAENMRIDTWELKWNHFLGWFFWRMNTYFCGCQRGTKTSSTWWFQIFFIFTPIWGRFPFWLIFFKWVETTNQKTSWFKLFPNTNSGFVGFGFSLFPVLVADEGSQESPSCNSPGGHYHGEAKCWW